MNSERYIIEHYDFRLDGNPLAPNEIMVNPDRNITKAVAKTYAKPNCKKCWGRGFCCYDHPTSVMYTIFCECVIGKLERAQYQSDLRAEYSKDGVLDIYEQGYRSYSV